MKEKLIILSDLWGNHDAEWVHFYTDILKEYFDILFYDSCQLGEVDMKSLQMGLIHKQFVSGGTEKAVENLLKLEKEPVNILAFSVGGLIAWKAVLQGLNAEYLCLVSASRLRYEKKKPSIKIDLFYGEEDKYKPKKDWFEAMEINPVVFKNEIHELYRNRDSAQLIVERIVNRQKNNG